MSSQGLSELDKHYDLRVTGPFKIGRSPLCNVILSDTHVSKVHCSVNICSNDDSGSRYVDGLGSFLFVIIQGVASDKDRLPLLAAASLTP